MKNWIATLLMICLLPITGYGASSANIHFVDQRADKGQGVILVAFNSPTTVEPILPPTGVLEKNDVSLPADYSVTFSFLPKQVAQYGIPYMGMIRFSMEWECKGDYGKCIPKDSIKVKATGTPNSFAYTLPEGQKQITVSGPFVADDGTVMFYIKDMAG